jgi:hypothetical protein
MRAHATLDMLCAARRCRTSEAHLMREDSVEPRQILLVQESDPRICIECPRGAVGPIKNVSHPRQGGCNDRVWCDWRQRRSVDLCWLHKFWGHMVVRRYRYQPADSPMMPCAAVERLSAGASTSMGHGAHQSIAPSSPSSVCISRQN